MSNRFSNLLRATARELASQAATSEDWFKDSVSDMQKGIQRRDPNKIFQKTSLPAQGSMYLFVYDPKYKKTLPFYDMYPLVFPIDMHMDGFLGINMHYLPPGARAQLLYSLDSIKSNNKYDESTKLNVSYRLLKAYSSQFAGFENCVKRYLYGHVRSSYFYIYPSDWEKVVMIPLQRWSVNPNKRYSGSPPY